MSDKLPDGWSTQALAEVADVVSGGTPARSQPLFWEGGSIDWITPTDITACKSRVITSGAEKITPTGLRSSSARLLPAGSLLMTSRATLGEIRIAATPMCTNQGFKSLVPRAGVDNWYLYYQMLSHREQYSCFGIGTTFLEVNKKDTERFKIAMAAKNEQPVISTILRTVDDAIEYTQSLISKCQSIKQGMMHDLFTRGVDENGELRPPYEVAPELYKKTELGWVPKGWEVRQLCREMSIKHGYAFDGAYFTEEPTSDLLLVPGNFHRDGGLYFGSANTKYYSGTVPSEYRLTNGDLLVVMTDLSPQTLILGRFAILRHNLSVLHNQRIGKCLLHNPLEWNMGYLLGALCSERLRREIIISATGTTVRHTSPTKILSHFIQKPPSDEQREINMRIQRIEASLQSEAEYRRKLIDLKCGLMHDLLTGKVRVPLTQSNQKAA